MTREEAIERLKIDIYKYADFTENPNENEFWMAFDMAIEALEKHCEDAISRKDVIQLAKESDIDLQYADGVYEFLSLVKGLPSVHPMPKTGHWIKENILTCKCSICGKEAIIANWQCILSDYCPNCGARMIEPQAE